MGICLVLATRLTTFFWLLSSFDYAHLLGSAWSLMRALCSTTFYLVSELAKSSDDAVEVTTMGEIEVQDEEMAEYLHVNCW